MHGSIQLPPIQQEGLASFYGAGEQGMHGKITATGEVFNPLLHTCASRTLPLNSLIVVQDLDTSRWTICRVNDRGPYGARIHKKYGGGWGAMYRRHGKYVVRRRSQGSWEKEEIFERRPGKYRGILDMSYGTALALGVDLDSGLNRVRVRHWPGHLQVSPRMFKKSMPIMSHLPSPTTIPATFF
jgi:rare lipoprotein A (peptidoglycan hydrolase)